MCGDLDHYHGTPNGEDEFPLDTPQMREFIAHLTPLFETPARDGTRTGGDRDDIPDAESQH